MIDAVMRHAAGPDFDARVNALGQALSAGEDPSLDEIASLLGIPLEVLTACVALQIAKETGRAVVIFPDGRMETKH